METTTDTTGDVQKVCRSGTLSDTVVSAVAEAKGVDVLDLDPLYESVDPDALNRLFSPSVGSSSTSLELRFPMAGCEVVVYGDGEVIVTPQSETEETSFVLSPGQN